ncbi:glycosyltransferase family 4 protein [Paenibacillus turpanensis]|uniref:glycosyltransferase family 4 protein n=1 Tax=Paenibacillus turpanensis TaxID=2689078 RepID=UPI00140DB0E8|nr:glycosyltransferase family 1 protein [Paenibacillus turpanensis]
MRVAIFTDTFLPEVNGVARTLGRWTNYLESQGIACKVFAPSSEERSEVRRSETMVERFYSIPFLLYPECKLAIPNPLNIKRTLKEFKPTLIHVATPFNLGLYGVHYAKKHRIPLVASYHTHFDQYLAHYRLEWLEAMLWRYMLWFHQDCRKVYVPSHSTLTHLQSKGFNTPLEIWGRGVDCSRFRPDVNQAQVLAGFEADPSKFTYLYVGRLAPEKSVSVLLDAFRQLPPEIAGRSQLLIAGDGPSYDEIAESLGESTQIKLLGFVQGQQLADLYAASDVFVFPSATETFGNVVLESMAAGTPVIGAKAGGVQDNVLHNQTGLLCPPGDVTAFRDAMVQLYRNAGQRLLMSAAGRAYAMQQSWPSIFDRLLLSFRAAAEADWSEVQQHQHLVK